MIARLRGGFPIWIPDWLIEWLIAGDERRARAAAVEVFRGEMVQRQHSRGNQVMKITIIEKPGDVCVWASLEESEPPASNECFVIGGGESKDAAIRDALETLDKASNELERMAGTKVDRIVEAAREETARGRAARRKS